MTGINGFHNFNFSSYYNNNSYSKLFSSGSLLGSGINYADYSLIKSGAYKKLLQNYFAKSSTSASTSASTTTQNNTILRDAANALKSSANALKDKSIWQQQSGQTVEDNESAAQDDLIQRIQSFVDDYNTVLDKAGASDNVTVLRNATRMVNTTSSMSRLLDEAGITIGSDNRLSIDETKLKQARLTTLNTLFAGSNSYGDRIAQRASNIVSILPAGSHGASSGSTVSSTQKSTTSSIYTKTGNYSDIVSKLVNGTVDEKI